MITPADELRAAAQRLRELAAAATGEAGDTWTAIRRHPDMPTSHSVTLWGSEQPFIHGHGGRGVGPFVLDTVGNYIAAMDPRLGVALARVLDQAADALTGTTVPDDDPVLAVARLINQQERP